MKTLDINAVRESIYVVPGVLIGAWIGEKVFVKISMSVFRKISITIIFLCGVISIINGII
jgi:uncharacterized membrane protein YfcA